MFELFRINNPNKNIFIIDNYLINKPLEIKTLDGRFLSCDISKNVVDFYIENDNSNRQNWIIENDENDENVFYIKCVFDRADFTQYLGCPNVNNVVFLYTTKNKYTKWNIVEQDAEYNKYSINYIGEKFNINEINIVVSRYNENIDWVIAYNDIITVYNKGPNLNLNLNIKNIFNIDNIGREGHTYLYHIINNYNNLSLKTIFTQANPFVHNDTFLFGIDNYEKTLDVQPLGLHYVKDYIPPYYICKKKTINTNYNLKYLVIEIDNNLKYCYPNNFYDYGLIGIINKYKKKFPNCYSIVDNFLLRSNFPSTKSTNRIRFSFAALLSVAKKNIHKYNIEVYKNLMTELISNNNQGGENGYILERLWLYIFE
jgi:hypothetical protein